MITLLAYKRAGLLVPKGEGMDSLSVARETGFGLKDIETFVEIYCKGFLDLQAW